MYARSRLKSAAILQTGSGSIANGSIRSRRTPEAPALHYLRRPPPSNEPRTPRTISRPTVDPTVRAARFANAEFDDCFLGVELRIRAHRFRRGLDRFLIARREGAQRMLDAIAELTQHGLRHVEGVLRHEIDADTLGADEPHDLLDLVQQRLRRIGKEQMRFVEEEYE